MTLMLIQESGHFWERSFSVFGLSDPDSFQRTKLKQLDQINVFPNISNNNIN